MQLNKSTLETLIPLSAVLAIGGVFCSQAYYAHTQAMQAQSKQMEQIYNWKISDTAWKSSIDSSIRELKQSIQQLDAFSRNDMERWTSTLQIQNPSLKVPMIHTIPQ